MPRIRPTLGLLFVAAAAGIAAPSAFAADDPVATPIVTPTPTPLPPTPTPRPPVNTSPPLVTFVSATDTSVTVRVDASSGANGGSHVFVRVDGKGVKDGNPGQFTLTGLQPGTSYAIDAQALYGFYGESGVSPYSTPITVNTLAAPAQLSFVGGTSLSLRGGWFTGVGSGTSAVSGTVNGTTGAFDGTIAIGQIPATITLLGAFPFKATLAFTPVGPATGTSDPTATTLTTSQDVAFKRVTFSGVSVAGTACHTAAPVTLVLKGQASLLTTGGIASGPATLGRLTGCSTFGTLTANNAGLATVALNIAPAPKPTPVPTPTPVATQIPSATPIPIT